MAHDRAGIHTDALSETAKYGYIPGLDGLRAIAVLVVIAAHFGVSNLIPGGFGVTLFFFISGFLITRLLIAEQGKSGTIALKNFYIRRLIRLFPALLFMVFGSTAIFALAGFGGPSKLEFLAAIGYFTNFFQVYSASTGAEMPYMSWTHLWSLAVEEHFYMLFPLVILAFGNTIDRLLKILLAILIIVPLWRLTAFTFFDFSTDTYNYMMTDARIDSIVWGCVFTIALHKAQSIDKFRAFIGLVPFGLALGALLFTFVFRDEMFRQVWRYSVQGLALMVLFLNLYYLKLLKFSFSILEWRPLVWIGQTSYALYLWHYPVLDFTQRVLGDGLLTMVVAFTASILITAFSFYVVEKPFIAMRKKFGSYIPVTQKVVA